MARPVLHDLLQAYAFWLMDVSPVDPLAIPILTPIFGFSSITAPEIVGEFQEISEGNWFFKKKILKRADVSNIVCERGIAWYDSDFWRWMMAGLTGDVSGIRFNIPGFPINISVGGYTPRRGLMLVQFFPRLPFDISGVNPAILQAGLGAAGGAAFSSGGLGTTLTAAAGAAFQQGVFSLVGQAIGPFEFAARLPAKAWLLHGCLPARYKVGTDFDGLSSAISIAQLEISTEMVEEISLSA